MVTIDALDKFVHSPFGNVLGIEFDEYAVGRLSVCADTWTRILCHVEDRPNVRVFSVTLSGNPFDYDHCNCLLDEQVQSMEEPPNENMKPCCKIHVRQQFRTLLILRQVPYILVLAARYTIHIQTRR